MKEIFNNTDQIDLEQVKGKLNPHLFSVVNIPKKLCVSEVSAMDLVLNPKRFDILIKYIYAKYHGQAGYEWTKDLYLNHIKIINNFKEQDQLKTGQQNFLQNFDALISSIKENGFNREYNVIPVSLSGVVTDGAHRVATSAAFGLTIPAVRVEANHCFDYHYFKEKGLSKNWLNRVLYEYFKLNPNAFLVNIFPKYNNKTTEVKNILNKNGTVYAETEIVLGEDAPSFLVRNYYENEHWLGTVKDNFKGSHSTGLQRFPKTPTSFKVFVFECDSFEKVLRTKNEIRAILNDDPYAVHINDDQEEGLRLASCYYNSNSLEFINSATLESFENFHSLFAKFKTWLKNNHLDKENYCVDSSGVLAAYGIRDCRDLDFLHSKQAVSETNNLDISSHNTNAHYYPISIEEILANPKYHFYYDGIKFSSIALLKSMKTKRGEKKDHEDLQLIDNFFNQRNSFAAYRRKWANRKLYQKYTTKVKRIALKIPKLVFRKTKESIRYSQYNLLNIGNAYEKVLDYHGYKLFHTKGTSIVHRFLKTSSYEPELSKKLVDELGKNNPPILLDVGANIGMISLYCLAHLPKLKIFAFEPGPLQNKLLNKTIAENNLQDAITLNDKALSNEITTTSFAIHSDEHNSGDGFLDTGRAGDTKTISVETMTIDHWWEATGQPKINVIKIDTEGAEFLILQGAVKMIEQLKPVLFLEIFYHNLKNYPHKEEDIYELLEKMGYELFLLNGRKVNRQDLIKLSLRVSEYVAYPM